MRWARRSVSRAGLLWAAASVLPAILALAGEAPPAPPGGDEPAEERPIGGEDLLEIAVFEVPELSRTVRVSEKGLITLPLLGEIRASGLTPRGLEGHLRDRLSERYVKNPQVSVFVREHGSKRVSVLGAVGRPGVYEMFGPRRLLQILAEAGGLREEAGREIHVIRTAPDGTARRISVSVAALTTESDPSLNIGIEPGDVVSVPIDPPLFIYVDGAVKTPGRIEQPSARPITLLQAIAKAGGATERANLKKVQILRSRDGEAPRASIVNVARIRKGEETDPVLGDGDIVVVPETFF